MPRKHLAHRVGSFLTSLVCLLASTRVAGAQTIVPQGFEDSHVATVASPTALAVTPDGRLLITSQHGQLYVYQNGALVESPVLDLGADVCAYRERGLVGVGVDSEFATNHFIYLSYNFNKFGDCEAEGASAPVGRVSRFVLADDNRIDRATELVLIDNVPSPIGVHNLDDVEVGKDGYLYISAGDGGCDYDGDSLCFDGNDAARDLNVLLGKVLRITRDGGIPPDNPFVGPDTIRCATKGLAAAGMVCQEIFATGLRNPWRIAFDPNAAGTRFLINDVGQDTWEEINEGTAGADYGWNLREGFCANGSTTDCSVVPPPGLTSPMFAYGRDEGCSAITGGAFVPNGAWPSAFDGIYLFSDYVCGTIFKLLPRGDGTYVKEAFVTGLGNSSATDLHFVPGSNAAGLYYTSYANGGEVRRITFVGGANRTPSAAFSAAPLAGPIPLPVEFDGTASSDPDGDALTYEWDFGDGTPGASAARAAHTYLVPGTYTATLRVTDPAGATSIATVRIDAGNLPPEPSIVSPGPDDTFAVGDTLVLRGRASDPEDGDLPDSSLSWRVLLHHNTHTHGFLPPTPGNNVSLRAPGPENLEAAVTSYLELQLTATDSKGLAKTIIQPFRPRMARLDFLSQPSGATLNIDNGLVTTPASFMSWANFGVTAEAEEQKDSQGTRWLFSSWSDGGAASHVITTPAGGGSYTALFTTQAVQQPTSLPGTIQAEDFDAGAAGVAYFDTTPENSGGQYRATEVDIEATSDVGLGFNVGWAFAGEWLNYTVNVAAAGQYDIGVRVASAGAGGTFHIEVNGVDKTGPLAVPDSGGWQTWTTIRKTGVSLSAGTQVWRLVMDTNGSTTAVGNFNWIDLTPAGGGGSTPFGAAPIALPGSIQAEDFDNGGAGVAYVDTTSGNAGGQYRATDVDIESSSGGGFNVGWAFAGEWLKYTVNVGVAGAYDIQVRVASSGAGGTFHIEVNGVDKTGPLTVPNTGSWQTWTTVSRTGVSLESGQQVWRLVLDTNGPTSAVGNFDWIRASVSDAATTAIFRQPYLQQVTENSAIIVWTTRDAGAAAVRYSTAAGGPIQVVPAETRLFSAAQTGLDSDYYHREARLLGLVAGTKYTYVILMGGVNVTATQDVFTTAPTTGTGTIRFVSFGDSGNGSAEQRQLATRLAADTFDLVLHTGDVAYGTADALGGPSYRQYNDWVFSIYAPFLRLRPFFPSIGNHDEVLNNAQAYRDVFVLPEGGASVAFPTNAERFYSFDYGPVHFVALDTELSFKDPERLQAQLTWLDADLSGTAQPWRIAFFHRPPFNAGAHHGSALEVRQAFAPVFERYRVQLVLSGHQHDYERSIPWREFTTDGGAVTYVVTGGGGAPLHDSGTAAWTAISASVHHYVRASVGGCILQLEAVRIDGVVFDQASIDRCTQSAAAAPSPDVRHASLPLGRTLDAVYLIAAIVSGSWLYSWSFFRRKTRAEGGEVS